MKIVHVNFVFHCVVAKFIGFPVSVSALGPTTGTPPAHHQVKPCGL